MDEFKTATTCTEVGRRMLCQGTEIHDMTRRWRRRNGDCRNTYSSSSFTAWRTTLGRRPLATTSCQKNTVVGVSTTRLADARHWRETGVNELTHASDDLHEVCGVCLGETTGCVHLVDVEGDVAGAELLDEEMAEEVVVLGEIAHVHDLCGTPFYGGGAGGGGKGRHGEGPWSRRKGS